MQKQHVKELGDLLRQSREEKNFSLKEVENATSIRMSYLKAIEDGEMNKLISPVYAQGFVKQYAAFLGLEGDQLIKEHQESFGKMDKQEFDYGIGTLEKRGHPASSSRLLPTVLYLLLGAGVLVLAWYFAKYLGVL
jgi:cytoskeletal protein RodZ